MITEQQLIDWLTLNKFIKNDEEQWLHYHLDGGACKAIYADPTVAIHYQYSIHNRWEIMYLGEFDKLSIRDDGTITGWVDWLGRNYDPVWQIGNIIVGGDTK